ncbi:hypothetical protein AWW66_10980 [Micromonospora rosaria]|uniref:Uncharacterized protein n=1 Tax=Micromonospora rosaria TaxID=47874 RepID=A0A136PUX1_9ACTN|nr:hypothetical protein [Micromonospora rosaria]KXK61956.1 hypothetical protein AWW66_10980 [Micromonospora rosaria]
MAQAGSRAAGAQSTPPADQTSTDPTPAGGGRVAELEAEVTRLRAEVARLTEQAGGRPAGPARPVEPSFVFSEGQRQELEATGRTVSPFTGARQVGTGRPGDRPREATPDEFSKAKPAEKPAAGRKR